MGDDSAPEGVFSLKTVVLILFVALYAFMIAKPNHRTWAALAAAVIVCALGVVTLPELPDAIDFNVLMMIGGTMLVVDYFIESGMPGLIAEALLKHSHNARAVVIYMSLFAGVVSAFIDNVATVLMIAPVGLAICKKLKINPVGMLLAIAVSSNLQGAATLVGDTTSIMLGAYAGMDFMSFFWMEGKPGIFWAVELGAAATVPVLMLLFRDMKQPVDAEVSTKVDSIFPSVMLSGIVLTLIAASFLPNKPALTNGIICCAYALVSMLWDLLRSRSHTGLVRSLRSVDLQTILLLTGLFVVIRALENVGLIDEIAEMIARLGGGKLFLLYTAIVWLSVAISAFVDNIPYVATMLPVVQGVAASMGIEPYLLYFGLLSGATLGGNLTPVGASANITATSILRREGCEVSVRDFARIGVPLTLTAVTVGYVFLWVFWK